MPLPPPTAEAQVAFLRDVQRLLAEGSFTATYKFALLQALADFAVLHGDDTGEALALRTRDIAEAMIGLYWRQALPYPGAADAGVLRQNTKRQAEIVTRLLRARRGADGSLARLRQDQREWGGLVRAVDRVVREMPLWRLQQVADTRLHTCRCGGDGSDWSSLPATDGAPARELKEKNHKIDTSLHEGLHAGHIA